LTFHYDDTLRAERKAQLAKACQDYFGFGLEHITFRYANWNLSTWRKDEMTEVMDNPTNMLNVMDKLWQEIADTDRNTTIKPFETSMSIDLPKVDPIKLYTTVPNIITTSGLVEVGTWSTGEDTTNFVSHGAVGTGTTTEALANVAMESEEDRKDFATNGTATMSGTTERYGMPFADTDLASGAGTAIAEAGLLTASSGGELISRVTATPVSVDSGRILTMQVDITNANGTVV
jgi:hypothetical protein